MAILDQPRNVSLKPPALQHAGACIFEVHARSCAERLRLALGILHALAPDCHHPEGEAAL